MSEADKSGKRVGLFVTCLVDFIRPAVGFAAVKLLEQAALAKCAERLSSKLDQKERIERERASLQEILDRLSSLPP